ncbi:putative transmembrane transcriptional regulator (anti-sigma factor) [Variovorax sp. PBS-H4]|nr:putative transmembrane transcriptional regulator (anti-sigma factor) [Variovorax sp. PBS-H4]
MKPPAALPPDTDQPAWRVQRDALRRLHGEVLDEPIPSSLLAAAEMVAARQDQHARWIRWSGIAAGLLVAFGVGWQGSAEWSTQRQASLAKAPSQREFVHAAAVAYAVYAPEKRHPVEVAAAEQEHLVQWLSKRLNKPLRVPDLSAQGYALVGGRLVPGSQDARAQFMFERGDGERLTLYIGSVGAAAAQPPQLGETAFRYSAEGAVSSFYWVDQGFGYALTGNLPREMLLNLAGAVYRQL